MLSLNLFILATLFCWSVWGIFDKKALQTGTAVEVLLRLYLLTLIEVPVAYLILQTTEPGWQIAPSVWLFTALASILQIGAISAYLAAMTMTEASYVLGLTAAYPLVLQFLAVPFLGEKLLLSRVAGAAAIGLGVAAIGAAPGKAALPHPGRQKLLLSLYVASATVGWGIWGVFDKKALQYGHPMTVFLAERLWELSFLVLGTLAGWWRGWRPDIRNGRTWLFSGLSGTSLAIGRWTYLNALSQASASYVIAITGCYPLLMYFLALIFLKEPFNGLRLTGVCLVVAGGIIVQLTQKT